MSALVEICAGTASVAMRALMGPGGYEPLVGYMGSKRRWAGTIASMLGFGSTPPTRIIIVDAGPWGDVWSTLSSPANRDRVADMLDAMEQAGPVWHELVRAQPAADDACSRAAQYLWLQARTANNIPIWWEAGRWVSPTGSRIARTVRASMPCQAGQQGVSKAGHRGMRHPSTIARRVRRLHHAPWDRVHVIHGDAQSVDPIDGAVVYIDPPYQHAPRYACELSRMDVVDTAKRWASAGCTVMVSESAVIDELGWPGIQIGRREWLTTSKAIRGTAVYQQQTQLFETVTP